MKYVKCDKCGLKHKAGTREATRDFVFADICIKCNKSFKALKFFKTAEDYQKYLRRGGELLDSVNINGVDYTMEEYDESGKTVVYANRRTSTNFEVLTENRYKLGKADAIVTEICEAFSWRNDIAYLD